MKFCHNCGTRLEDQMEYCPNCGTLQLRFTGAGQNVTFETDNAPGESIDISPVEPVQAAEAVELPEPVISPIGNYDTERPVPPSTLEYGKAPSFDPEKRVQMPTLGAYGGQNSFGSGSAETFQGRPVNAGQKTAGQLNAGQRAQGLRPAGRVPAGTEGSFSANYGRGTAPNGSYTGQQGYTGQPAYPGQPAYGNGTAPAAGTKGTKKSGKRALIVIIVILVLIAAIAAVAIGIAAVAGSGSGAEPVSGSSDHIIYSGGEIMIGDAYMFKDFAGDDAIAVEVTWTNNGSSTGSPLFDLECHAMQDGEELIETFPDDADDLVYQSDLYYSDVEPGDSVTFVICFDLENTTDPVEVTIGAYNTRGEATCTFNLD